MASAVSSRSAAAGRGSSKMDALRELSKGLKIEAEFCPTDVADPFDTVEWELRTAEIKDENGELIFEQTDCRDPGVLEPARHQRRGQQVLLRRDRHARARTQRPPAHPPRHPDDRRLGQGRRLLRHDEDAERFYAS